jgi:hypothetical protein
MVEYLAFIPTCTRFQVLGSSDRQFVCPMVSSSASKGEGIGPHQLDFCFLTACMNISARWIWSAIHSANVVMVPTICSLLKAVYCHPPHGYCCHHSHKDDTCRYTCSCQGHAKSHSCLVEWVVCSWHAVLIWRGWVCFQQTNSLQLSILVWA